ncbi:MAG: fructose-bisphosphatase class II, partial [Elusimicrobia bacterium]|nr:fructose-bisphosphatase class II [Elusimicrobiota bacterium]
RLLGLCRRADTGSSGLTAQWPMPLGAYEDFFTHAFTRNEQLVKNLFERMNATGQTGAVLVAGGFHTDGLREIFTEKKISHVVVTPRISAVDKADDYLAVFARGRNSLEKLMLGEKLFVRSQLPLALHLSEGFDYLRPVLQRLINSLYVIYSLATVPPAAADKTVPLILAAVAKVSGLDVQLAEPIRRSAGAVYIPLQVRQGEQTIRFSAVLVAKNKAKSARATALYNDAVNGQQEIAKGALGEFELEVYADRDAVSALAGAFGQGVTQTIGGAQELAEKSGQEFAQILTEFQRTVRGKINQSIVRRAIATGSVLIVSVAVASLLPNLATLVLSAASLLIVLIFAQGFQRQSRLAQYLSYSAIKFLAQFRESSKPEAPTGPSAETAPEAPQGALEQMNAELTKLLAIRENPDNSSPMNRLSGLIQQVRGEDMNEFDKLLMKAILASTDAAEKRTLERVRGKLFDRGKELAAEGMKRVPLVRNQDKAEQVRQNLERWKADAVAYARAYAAQNPDADLAAIEQEIENDIYNPLKEAVEKIAELRRNGEIDPEAVLLKLSQNDRDPRIGVSGRPARVGFLPMKGDPWQTGHIFVMLAAIAEQKLDKVVIAIDNSDPERKPNLSSLSIREAITLELLKVVEPFVEYTPVAKEEADLFTADGETMIFRLMKFNRGAPLHWFYMVGSDHRYWVNPKGKPDTAQKLSQHMQQKKDGFESERLGVIFIERKGEEFKPGELEDLRNTAETNGMQGVQKIHQPMDTSSTRVRKEKHWWTVPSDAYEMSVEFGFWGAGDAQDPMNGVAKPAGEAAPGLPSVEEAERIANAETTFNAAEPNHQPEVTHDAAVYTAAGVVAEGHRGAILGVTDKNEVRKLKDAADGYAKLTTEAVFYAEDAKVVVHVAEGIGRDEVEESFRGAEIINPNGRQTRHIIIDVIEGTNATASNNEGKTREEISNAQSGGTSAVVAGDGVQSLGNAPDVYADQFVSAVPASERARVQALVQKNLAAEDEPEIREVLEAVASANGISIDDMEIVIMKRDREARRMTALKAIQAKHPGLVITQIKDGTVVHGLLATVGRKPGTGKHKVMWTAGGSAEAFMNLAVAAGIPGGLGALRLYTKNINTTATGEVAMSFERRFDWDEAEKAEIREIRPQDAEAIFRGERIFTISDVEGNVEGNFAFITDNGVFNVPGVREIRPGVFRVHTLRILDLKAFITVEDITHEALKRILAKGREAQAPPAGAVREALPTDLPKVAFGTAGVREVGLRIEQAARVAQAVADEAPGLVGKSRADLRVVVGYDARYHGQEYAQRIVEVLAANGIKPHLNDQVAPTPVMGESTRAGQPAGEGYDLAIQLTASHNPVATSADLAKDFWQGIKVMLNGVPIDDARASKISERANQLTEVARMPHQAQAVDLVSQSNARLRQALDFDPLQAKLAAHKAANPEFGVVIDSMHGGTVEAAKVIRELGVVEEHLNTTPIHQGNHPLVLENGKIWAPDPTKPQNYPEFLGKLKPGQFGVLFDGDGDRAVLRDVNGREITPNQLGLIFAHYLYHQYGVRGTVVRSLPSTRGLDRFYQRMNLAFAETPVGSKNFAPYLGELIVAIEESGHVFFRIGDEVFADSAVAEAVLALDIIATTGKSLTDYLQMVEAEPGQGALIYNRSEVTPSLVTDDFKAGAKGLRKDGKPQLFAETLAQKLGKGVGSYDASDSGGVLVRFTDGTWAMYRVSGT